MASVIITNGELDDPRMPLSTDADKVRFRQGMIEFGQVFQARYSSVDPDDDGARAGALLSTFTDVIGSAKTSTTGYYAYCIRERNGRARQIYNPVLRDESGSSRERWVILFERETSSGTGAFRIIARPDRSKRMHVSLPSIAAVSTYLQVTNEQHKLIRNEPQEIQFLLANTLISRCK